MNQNERDILHDKLERLIPLEKQSKKGEDGYDYCSICDLIEDTEKEAKKLGEEAEYKVTAKLTNIITFSPIPRDTPLTKLDAIANAEGTVSDTVWQSLEEEGWTVEFEAEKL